MMKVDMIWGEVCVGGGGEEGIIINIYQISCGK